MSNIEPVYNTAQIDNILKIFEIHQPVYEFDSNIRDPKFDRKAVYCWWRTTIRPKGITFAEPVEVTRITSSELQVDGHWVKRYNHSDDFTTGDFFACSHPMAWTMLMRYLEDWQEYISKQQNLERTEYNGKIARLKILENDVNAAIRHFEHARPEGEK